MEKVLVFSYQRTALYRYADINFYNEIKKKILQILLLRHIKCKIFNHLKLTQKIFKKNTKFKKAKTLWIDSFFQAAKVFLKYDVVIFCGLFGSYILSDYAKKLGLKVILVDQNFNYDYFINENVDLVILRNNYGFKRFKNLNQKYKGRIKVVSSIDAGEINFPLYKK